MTEWEKVPLGNHNAYYRYVPNKKTKIWILLVIIFLIGVAYKVKPEIFNKTFYTIKAFGIGTSKPKYYCESTNETCINLFNEFEQKCNNSIFVVDTETMITKIDITNNGDTCNVMVFVEGSVNSQFKGTSMSCNVPMSKTNILLQSYSVEFLKYCDGSLKDVTVENLQKLGQAIWENG
jgi:hypothetical protein